MANERLTVLAKRFRELKDLKAVLEAQLKTITEEIDSIAKDRLPAMMDENDIPKFTVDGVGTIYQQVKVYAYVAKADEEIFHNWLRENGNGDMIRPYVFPQTLAAFAKEQLEQGVDLPDWLKATKVPTAMLRRK